jgi:hypothetical protein
MGLPGDSSSVEGFIQEIVCIKFQRGFVQNIMCKFYKSIYYFTIRSQTTYLSHYCTTTHFTSIVSQNYTFCVDCIAKLHI